MQTSSFTFGPVRIMEGIYMADDLIAEVNNSLLEFRIRSVKQDI